MSPTMEANHRLATALGWTNIVDVGNALLGKPTWVCDNSRDQVKIPNWAGDWKDCGPLLSQYVIHTSQKENHVVAVEDFLFAREVVMVKFGEDRDAATRLAIVRAAIRVVARIRPEASK